MLELMAGLTIVVALGLIGFGVYSEIRTRQKPPDTAIEEPSLDDLFPTHDLPPAENVFQKRLVQFQMALKTHPAKPFAIIETVFWLACLIPLIDHALKPQGSWSAYITWWLVIGPHEVGHLICAPFGTLLMFLGGSIWQVLFWILLGLYMLLVRKHITSVLICWMIVGHSFIDMSVYIGDARSRDLPLLFGMDSSHHDWWNILRRLGLLKYDHLIAETFFWWGVFVILVMIMLGMWTAWVFPRLALGKSQRYRGIKTLFRPKNYSSPEAGIPST
jgi:hypothetical protein